MTRRWCATKVVRTLLFVGAASAALAAAGPDALLPFRDVAGAAAEVSVAFVVDFGGGSAAVVGCVKVPAGDNGYDALAVFTAQEHESAPIYNSSGLLCSINDIPGNTPAVCGQVVPGGYDYWSYWHGSTGAWTYANSGAFGAVQPGDVEGWRYEDPGASKPTDPKPGATPDYTSICGVPSSAPATPTSAAAPTTTAPPAPASSPGAVRSTTGTVAPAPAPAPIPAVSTPGSGTRTDSTTVPAARSVPSTPPTVSASTSTTAGSGHQSVALGATPTASDHPGGGSAAPLVVGGALIVLLAAGAIVGWRRRSSSP
jgi:hypothetical protein